MQSPLKMFTLSLGRLLNLGFYDISAEPTASDKLLFVVLDR